MEHIRSGRLAMVFAGCFLGAGYVSGQELWQYFGSFGLRGFFGLILAMLLLAGSGILIIRLVQRSGITEADRLMTLWDFRPLQLCAAALVSLLMLAVVLIMTAGVGALLEQLSSIPHFYGSLFFAVLIWIVALTGVTGLIRAFSATVPVLILCTLFCGVLTISRFGFPSFTASSPGNSLLGSWYIAAFNFASYNILGTIPILAPISPRIPDGRTALRGVLLGTAALLLIALSVLVSLFACANASETELPMLYCASRISPLLAVLYAILLFLGMFGTGLSSFVGFLQLLEEKYRLRPRSRFLLSLCLISSCFVLSLFGFGNLIGALYPLFGYSSVLFLGMMLLRYIRLSTKQ